MIRVQLRQTLGKKVWRFTTPCIVSLFKCTDNLALVSQNSSRVLLLSMMETNDNHLIRCNTTEASPAYRYYSWYKEQTNTNIAAVRTNLFIICNEITLNTNHHVHPLSCARKWFKCSYPILIHNVIFQLQRLPSLTWLLLWHHNTRVVLLLLRVAQWRGITPH